MSGVNGAPVSVLLNDVYDDGESGVPTRAVGDVDRGIRGSAAIASPVGMSCAYVVAFALSFLSLVVRLCGRGNRHRRIHLHRRRGVADRVVLAEGLRARRALEEPDERDVRRTDADARRAELLELVRDDLRAERRRRLQVLERLERGVARVIERHDPPHRRATQVRAARGVGVLRGVDVTRQEEDLRPRLVLVDADRRALRSHENGL